MTYNNKHTDERWDFWLNCKVNRKKASAAATYLFFLLIFLATIILGSPPIKHYDTEILQVTVLSHQIMFPPEVPCYDLQKRMIHNNKNICHIKPNQQLITYA